MVLVIQYAINGHGNMFAFYPTCNGLKNHTYLCACSASSLVGGCHMRRKNEVSWRLRSSYMPPTHRARGIFRGKLLPMKVLTKLVLLPHNYSRISINKQTNKQTRQPSSCVCCCTSSGAKKRNNTTPDVAYFQPSNV